MTLKKCSQFVSQTPMFGKLKTKLRLISAKKTNIPVGSKYCSSISQSHYCISNNIKVKCRPLSRKFHGEMTLLAKPMKIHARLFCSIINVLHFCLRSVFTFIFQCHMKVALFEL